MKVQRYPIGRSNVAQLKSQQANLIKSGEAAQLAAASYEAVADASKNIAGDLQQIAENRIAAEDADDNATAELNFGQAQAQRKMIDDMSKLEKWTPERYQEEMDAVTTSLLASNEQITERNRGKFDRTATAQASIWQFQTASTYNYMKFEQSVIKTDAAVELAMEGLADPDTRAGSIALVNNQINAAVEDGRYSREHADEKIQSASDTHLGYEMADQYKAAVEAGTDADYMANMANEQFADETINTFYNEKKLYDSQMGAKIAEEQEVERLKMERAFVNVQQEILFTPIDTQEDLAAFATSYSNDALNNYADANKLSLSNREKLFTKRNQRLKQLASRGNKEAGGDIEPDLTTKAYREDITSRGISELGLNAETAGPAERDALVKWEVDNAPKFDAIGQTTTNFVNNSATRGWDEFLSALPIYEKLSGMDDLVWDGIDVKNREMYETVRYMNYQDNPDLARQIWVNYRAASPTELSMAQEQYDQKDLMEAIESSESRSDTAGLIRSDNWLWFNKVADMPNSTKAQIARVAKSMATIQSLTNGTVNYSMLADTVADVMGTMVTTSTLNAGVPSGSDSLGRISAEVMLNAPVKKEGEAWARLVLEQDYVPEGEEPMKVKAFNQEMTIVAPYEITMEGEKRLEMSGESIGVGISETLPDPYEDIPGSVIPVNMIQVVTAPLKQNQFNDNGERVWHVHRLGTMIFDI